MTPEKTYWVYILLCDNNSYYTGITSDMPKRYRSHRDGTGGCKYTRSFKPLSIAQCWEVCDKSSALKLEQAIKKLSRAEKDKIILHPETLIQDENIKIVTQENRLAWIKEASPA